jgi:hypothetical protein
MIYVDEFLHAKWWRHWWWMPVWKMKTKMTTICLLNVCIVESYVHAFITVESDVYIHIGDDRIFISILTMTKYFVFILETINDIVVSWGDDLGDNLVPHAYKVVSRAHCIHSSLCEYVHCWIMWIIWLCGLVIICIGETRWIMWTWWFGELYELVIWWIIWIGDWWIMSLGEFIRWRLFWW